MSDAEAPEKPKPRRGRPPSRLKIGCELCRKEFLALPSEIARGAGRYCSTTCRDEARSRQRKPVEDVFRERPTPKIELVCETCGKPFNVNPHRSTETRQARYCSVECSRPLAGRLSTTRMVEAVCGHCKNPFQYRSTERYAARHCSMECRRRSRLHQEAEAGKLARAKLAMEPG